MPGLKDAIWPLAGLSADLTNEVHPELDLDVFKPPEDIQATAAKAVMVCVQERRSACCHVYFQGNQGSKSFYGQTFSA